MFDIDKLNNVFFIYTFIKIRCNKLFVNWKLENCIETIQKSNCMTKTINIEALLNYLESSESGTFELIQNYTPKDIYESFFINDDLKPLDLKNKHELLMELLHIKRFKSKFILI